MHDTPPSEAIRQTVGIHLNMLNRQTRRDYAGFAVGKRRKLAIVPRGYCSRSSLRTAAKP